jgi:tRNA pseudouridine55 synthase
VSAVHVDGVRAYARVRRGESLELAARPVTIHRLALRAWDPATGQLELTVRCSAGTYIRSLARDLGTALGCGGSLARLRRTEALGFSLEQAVPLEALDAGRESGAPPPQLLDSLVPLAHLPWHQLSTEDQAGWRCGRAPLLPDTLAELAPDSPVVVLEPDGNLAGMARTAGGVLQPKLVLDAAG